ncbi:MAG: carbon-nitrogen hydrolase family protein [Planctomycetota bacterium]|nr:carbon-nitrogen hydrolase family protein [Planctomycetota bacterium]
MEKHVVAVCQINCGPDSWPAENAEKLLSCLHRASADGARLVLFPELCLSGYPSATEDISERLRATTSEQVESIRACVQRLEVAAVVGLCEQADDNKVYNVSLAIAPDGSETRYRKIHIPGNEGLFAPGDYGPAVADFGFVRLGISTCYDNWFGESARMAYLAGAEMLHMPFYWPAEWEVRDEIESKRTPMDNNSILKSRRERMMKVFPARAIDNGMYAVMVDQVAISDDLGKHLPGKSMVFDPYGELLAETKGWKEETLYFEFVPERVQE